METVKNVRHTKKQVTAPLTKRAKDDVMRKITSSKVAGVSYIEFVNEGTAVWPPPSSPPWTTWNGLMLCAPDSPHAKRLIKKCGGVSLANDGTESDAEKAAAVLGFWTAPEDWHEMLAENAAVKLT